MKTWSPAVAIVTTLAISGGASPADQTILSQHAQAARLEVSSPAFDAGASIPFPYTAYGENFSPALTWRGAPAGTQSFVVIVEDTDAKAPAPSPFVHWTVYDLPPELTALHESVPAIPRLPAMGGAYQGRTSRGSVGYFGPRPPGDDGAHHYHFEVFALDTRLSLPPAAAASEIAAKMQGHVVAAGELVGTFGR